MLDESFDYMILDFRAKDTLFLFVSGSPGSSESNNELNVPNIVKSAAIPFFHEVIKLSY